MAKRPVPKYDFKAFGAAIKAARTGRKESRKKVSDEMFISPRYLANIENKGQHPSLQIFFELMLRYNISVDQFLLETPPEKNTQRRQLDALLDGMSDTGIRIVTATAKEISEVKKRANRNVRLKTEQDLESVAIFFELQRFSFAEVWQNSFFSVVRDKGIRDKNIRSKHRKRVPTSVFSPSRAAARRLKMACWEVSQTLGTERKGANTWTDAKGQCKSNSE